MTSCSCPVTKFTFAVMERLGVEKHDTSAGLAARSLPVRSKRHAKQNVQAVRCVHHDVALCATCLLIHDDPNCPRGPSDEQTPQVCPKCGNGSFTTLWLTKPNSAINGQMWAKWYFWCDKCLSGIRCPLGTWRIPRTTPYILHGDGQALAAALP